jgi:pilus assembly protein CpaB
MGRRTVLLIVAVVIALLGAGLVFLYVQGLENDSVADQAPRRVLVATELISPGEAIADAQSAGKVDFANVAAEDILDGALSSTDTLEGTVALTTLYPQEQIISAKFGEPGQHQDLTIPKGKIAVSVQLTDPARVAGFVVPGSEVAVFASGTSTDAGGTTLGNFTRLLLPSAEVIGVGQTALLSTTTVVEDGAAQTVEEIPKTILTLALSVEDSERVLFAARAPGELAFGLLTDKSDVAKSDGVTSTNLFK